MPVAAADEVTRAIRTFADTGVGDVKKLQGYQPPVWRLRVGNWQVLYRREDRCMLVRRILDRKDAYRS